MVQLTSRDTSEETPEERAERQRLATDEWLKAVREHKANMKSRITAEEILAARDAGRK